MKRKVSIIGIILFTVSCGLSAQNNANLNLPKVNVNPESVSEISLIHKGVIVFFDEPLTEYESTQLLEINFDAYRMVDNRATLLIQDGPRLELLSFNEMLKLNYKFNSDLYKLKLSENITPEKYSSVPVLNIDFGKTRVYSEME